MTNDSGSVERIECREAMEKVDDRVTSIQMSVASMEIISKKMEAQVDKLYNVMYGNGKPGLLERFSGQCTKVNLQWFFLSAILATIIGLALTAK